MATTTKTITENEGSARATWTITLTGTDRKVTGATFYAPTFSVSAKYVYSYKNHATFNLLGIEASIGSERKFVGEGDIYNAAWNSGATKNVPITWQTTSFNTADVFNSSNKTIKTISVSYVNAQLEFYSYQDDLPVNYGYWSSGGYNYNLGTFSTVTLDVPPTFSETFSYTGDFSGVPYANLTTASITLSSLAAYYGGDFSGVGNAEFIIGSQSVSKPNPVNGDVLTIALNSVGTFTPTIKVTDSRGQVTTHTLPAITVMGYNAPTVSFNASRTTSAGAPDDEGTYGFLEATLNFTDAIADAVAPSVVMTEDDGTTSTPTVSWYTDNTLTTPVTWSSLSTGATVYGIFSGLSTQHSYTVSVRPRDSEGTGTAVSQTIGAAFYTVDFLAGGHGIAFGQPASNIGFECAMTALFEDNATFGSDVLIDLPEYQTASTTDKAIYDAVVALGWDSDVLVN